jgi:hypothetical protein
MPTESPNCQHHNHTHRFILWHPGPPICGSQSSTLLPCIIRFLTFNIEDIRNRRLFVALRVRKIVRRILACLFIIAHHQLAEMATVWCVLMCKLLTARLGVPPVIKGALFKLIASRLEGTAG